MQSSGSSSAATVSFTTMAEGTREDYELLARFEEEFAAGLADRVLAQRPGPARRSCTATCATPKPASPAATSSTTAK